MEKQKVDMFLAQHSDKFPAERLSDIKAKLEAMSDDKFMVLNAASFKDPSTMMIISIVAGGLGIDRFMIGDTGVGVGKLLTTVLLCGAGYIWVIIDWFQIKDATKKANAKRFDMLAM